jgi:hypothetical protein
LVSTASKELFNAPEDIESFGSEEVYESRECSRAGPRSGGIGSAVPITKEKKPYTYLTQI